MNLINSPPTPPPHTTAGFGMLEVMIAMTILLVGVLGFIQAITGSLTAQRAVQQRGVALAAARQMIERLRAEPLGTVFADYNGTELDDLGAPGSAPGANFAVPGLPVAAADVDGLAGEIRFPTAALTGAGWLREDLINITFGLPFDLDRDGVIDDTSKSADYQLLPVAVRVEWADAITSGRVELRAWLGPQ